MCVHTIVQTVVHNTVQSNSDYLPSYPPGKHRSSHAVYWRGGGHFTHLSHAAKALWRFVKDSRIDTRTRR